MILPTFESWEINAKAAFLETHKKEACWNCSGDGEVDCCECGHVRECDECEGHGFLFKNLKTGEEVKMIVASPSQYYRSMMIELSRLAKWQGKSPVALMLPFARGYRKQNPMAVRLRKHALA